LFILPYSKRPTKDTRGCRGRLEKRTLSTLDEDLDHMTHIYNGDTKKAKLCNNVIGKRVFNVPIDQV